MDTKLRALSPTRKHFIYNSQLDQYECQRGNKIILPFKGIITNAKGYQLKTYRSHVADCKNCPFRIECCGKSTKYKKISDSIDKPYYDRMHEKLTANHSYAKKISKIRSRTVEPVLGTLINFLNMKKVNSRGIQQANKHIMMAALTYNLKKYMKFISRQPQINLMAMREKSASFIKSLQNELTNVKSAILRQPYFYLIS